jgi:hypothetical protein
MDHGGGETLISTHSRGLLECGLTDIIYIERNKVATNRSPQTLFALATAALLAACAPAWASPGVAGADVLKTPVEARGWGIGGAYSVVGDDAGAMMYNPAGLCLTSEREFRFTHLSMMEGTFHEALLASYPLGRWGTGGITYIYRGTPEIDNGPFAVIPGKDPVPDVPVHAYDTVLGGYVSFRFSHLLPGVRTVSPLSVGLGIKQVSMTLGYIKGVAKDFYKAKAIALDWGLLLQLDPFRVSLSGRNFGGDFSFLAGQDEPLPQTLSVGLGVIPYEDSGNFMIVALENSSYVGVAASEKTEEETITVSESLSTFSIGAEYWRLKKMGVRIGYMVPWGPEKSSYQGAKGLSVGASIRVFSDWLTYQVDIAYHPYKIGASRQDALSLSLGVRY